MEQCNICEHPPIRHVREGNSWTCLVCVLMVREGMKKEVCTQQMNFKLSQHEREQAMDADKASYPPRIICAQCFYSWEQHVGYLCPSGDDTFLPLLTAGDDYRA